MDNDGRMLARVKEYAVYDCLSLAHFAYKYYKPESFVLQGLKYVETVLLRKYEDVLNYGYTMLPSEINFTGRPVGYIPKPEELEEIKEIMLPRIQAAREEERAKNEAIARNKRYASLKRRRGRPRKNPGQGL